MAATDFDLQLHPCVDRHESILAALRNEPVGPRRVVSEARVVPGCYFTWDQQGGEIALDIDTAAPDILAMSAQIRGAPTWFSLNFELGSGSFRAGDVLGVVMRVFSDAPTVLKTIIRSGLPPEPERDTELSDMLRFGPERPTASIIHRVAPHDAVTQSDRFHCMHLELPRSDFKLRLSGMRFFVQGKPQA